MKRRRVLLLGAVAAVGLGVFAGWPRGPREPVYRGEPLSNWIQLGGTWNERPLRRMRAEKVIRSLGTNALPWLMSEFTRPGSRWRAAFNQWAQGRTRLRLDDGQVRIARAGFGLELMGPAIAPALPELSRHLGDPRRSRTAAQAMAGAGELALPYFVQRMNSNNSIEHFAAGGGLGELARTTPAAVPRLVQVLRSTNRMARIFAIRSMRDVSTCPEITIPALTKALTDSERQVRSAAVQIMAGMRSNSAPRIAELRRLLPDTNLTVALSASNALHLLHSTNLPMGDP